jgi:thioredoxin reductase (NADPH)
MNTTDIVIIGAGPVGLFAIFECGMLGLKCHVVDALPHTGGQCSALYPEKPIYDIPAFPMIEAQQLIENLEKQAESFSPTYHLGEQILSYHWSDGHFILETDKGTRIQARGIILAAGVGAFGPNRPPLEGIEGYEGKSVFYSVTNKERFRGKRVLIAGGGDSAVDWALALADIASYVGVVHRRPKFRAAPESLAQLDKLVSAGQVEMLVPYQLAGLQGDGAGTLSAVELQDLDGHARTIAADILLPFYGLSMNLGPLLSWNLAMDHHTIAVDPATAQTSQSGIYAIGDIATYPGKLKLILTGFAEAARAAHSLRTWLYPDEVRHFEYSTTQGVPGS